jgi:hypothetical protein
MNLVRRHSQSQILSGRLEQRRQLGSSGVDIVPLSGYDYPVRGSLHRGAQWLA